MDALEEIRLRESLRASKEFIKRLEAVIAALRDEIQGMHRDRNDLMGKDLVHDKVVAGLKDDCRERANRLITRMVTAIREVISEGQCAGCEARLRWLADAFAEEIKP